MKVDDARNRVVLAQQERLEEFRKQAEEYRNRLQGQVDDRFGAELNEHNEMIRMSSEGGLWEVTSCRAANEEERILLDRLKEYYIGEGYKAKLLQVSVDIGDCVIDQLQLTIDWRE